MSETALDPAPWVSVVIPCYNGAAFLREAVDSTLAQTYPRVEAVVVDDGSTDDTPAVIESYGERVVGIRQQNQGLPRSRNNGVAHARGDHFLFLDADDLIAPDAVRALVEAVGGDDATIGACPWSNLVLRDGAWVRAPSEVPFPQTGPDPLDRWLRGEWIPGCSLLGPRALLERLGGYDGELTADEDGDLMYRALVSGARLRVASGGESFYRRHGSAAISMSHDVFSEHRFRSRMRAFQKLEMELRRHGKWETYREALGIAYQELAQRSFGARPDLAREALLIGEEYAGRRAAASTLPGRLLVRLLGMERKERVVQALARLGVATRNRRSLMERRRALESTVESPEARR